MKELILIIGSDISINTPFLNYILKDYRANFGSLADIKFIDRAGGEIFTTIKELTNEYKKITAYASSQNYPLIAKILATLTNDLLELRDETLMPTMAQESHKDSFVVSLNRSLINLVKASPLNKLPKLLLDTDNDKVVRFFIYGFEEKSSKESLDVLGAKFEIDITLSSYSKFIMILSAKKRKFGNMAGFLEEAKEIFKDKLIFEDTLAKFMAEKLKQRGEKVSFAESCTAGLIAAKIGEISGASEVFDGSLVTYANHIKSSWLGVSDETLEQNGAVSKECVSEMLDGVLEMSGADFALAVSGIAGPTGGSSQKPVGTVFIGAKSSDGRSIVKGFLFSGDRDYIRDESVNVAFSMLFELGEFFKE